MYKTYDKCIFALFVIFCALFYANSFRGVFIDVESHIPATILAQKYGYDLAGYGLSFVSADGVEHTYGVGAFEILDKNITPHSFSHYTSTIGLQGFIYAAIYQALSPFFDTLKPLYAINALLNAAALSLLLVLIARIFSLGFGVVFACSLFAPWVIKFNTSLYFSFASFILPSICAFSLYLVLFSTMSGGGDKEKVRGKLMALFLGYGFCVALRASLSYEFITSIVAFSLSPFLIAALYSLLSKNTHCPSMKILPLKKSILAFLFLLLASILGFACVFIYHTYIRGGGDFLLGLKDIYERDFLRRMIGGKGENFTHPLIIESLNASIFNVIKTYLNFQPIKYLFPLCVFVILKEQNTSYKSFYIALLVCFYLPALSWFIFGKAHSYVHTHFCFVLYYLGFVASLMYIPAHSLYLTYKEKYAKT